MAFGPLRRASNDWWRRAHGWRTRDGRWVAVAGLALAMAASCGTGASHVRTVRGYQQPPRSHSIDGGRMLEAAPTTTSTEAHAPAARASRSLVAPRATPTPPAVPPSSDIWAALGNCESHNNPTAVGHGTDGRGHPLTFYGAFQFTLDTWHSLGYSGSPVDHPYEVQREAAQRLVARSGWGQFPYCSRKLGMR